jgi:hypothetical protein
MPTRNPRSTLSKIPSKAGGRSPYQTFVVINPGKGLDNLLSDNMIDDHEASSLENIRIVESGAPAKATGYTVAGTGLSNNPRGLGFFNDTIAGNKTLLTMDGTALKYLTGNTWTTISGASFDASSQINFTVARGSMFVLDGVSPIAKLATGNTLTRNGHSPKAKFSIYYQGRHFAAGVDGQPNRLYISKTTDASEFTVTTGGVQPQPDNSNDADSGGPNVPGATAFSSDATGNNANAQVVDINKFDGDKITALGKFQDALIIYKERGIFQLTLDSTGLPVIASITKSYGCVSHRSVDNVENDAFFLSRNGGYVLGNEPNYFNVIRTNELTARIHGEIENINPTNYTNASALFSQYVYYLGIPSGGVTSNNVTLTYDRRFQAWSKLTHIQPECFTLYTDSTNTDTVYFTSATDANVYKFTSNYDANGAAISAQWTSKFFDLGQFSLYKRWIWVDILFRQLVGTIKIDIYTDNGTLSKSTSVTSSQLGGLGTNLLGGGDWLGSTVQSSSMGTTTTSTNIPYRVKIGVKSRGVKVKISNARINETFVVLGLEFAYEPYSAFVFPSSQKLQ